MSDHELPLGQKSAYVNRYAPEVLHPIARADSRSALSLDRDLPFDGVDIWNAWELTWLGQHGCPIVATAEIQVPATTPNLIESKSLKLYLNSFAMSRYDDPGDVVAAIAKDLTRCAGAPVVVTLNTGGGYTGLSDLSSNCIDAAPARCNEWQVNAELLRADAGNIVDESLHSHLLRSLCPVTGQPDLGSIAIRYRGPKIDRAALLQYVVSFREHNEFHEACIERMFVDIQQRCNTRKLSLYARYQRRGGIDINPFRSDFEDCPGNPRLWRQ